MAAAKRLNCINKQWQKWQYKIWHPEYAPSTSSIGNLWRGLCPHRLQLELCGKFKAVWRSDKRRQVMALEHSHPWYQCHWGVGGVSRMEIQKPLWVESYIFWSLLKSNRHKSFVSVRDLWSDQDALLGQREALTAQFWVLQNFNNWHFRLWFISSFFWKIHLEWVKVEVHLDTNRKEKVRNNFVG